MRYAKGTAHQCPQQRRGKQMMTEGLTLNYLCHSQIKELIDELREMETVDRFNDELREGAEQLLADFKKLADEYNDLRDRTYWVRGCHPESYAHLYIAKNGDAATQT